MKRNDSRRIARRVWGFILSVARGHITNARANRMANGILDRDDVDWRFRD
jgi:hypothetical protein